MDFIKNPNLPVSKVKTVLVDCRTSMQNIQALNSLGIETIPGCMCMELYDSVKGHPDIVLHPLGDNIIVVAPNVYDYYHECLSKKGFAVIRGSTWLCRNYPENIAYNVLRIGKKAFHNTKYTDPIIMDYFNKEKIELIHVKQGYTKCSVCIVDETSIITSDKSIAAAAEHHGIESLVIEPGNIVLEGMDYGFIGGATGLLSNSELAFAGLAERLPDYHSIDNFLKKRGMLIIQLSDSDLADIGSIIPISV